MALGQPPAMQLHIHLQGGVALRDAKGSPLAPLRSRKVQGLLALLATGPGMRRRRVDLQALLWSDRSPEQRSASLRQALSELRHALGPFGPVLGTSRSEAWLDAGRVVMAPPDPADPREFLDELAIPDPAFDAWLRIERGRRRTALPGAPPRMLPGLGAGGAPPLRRPALFFLRETPADPGAAMISQIFADALARTISEHFTVDIGETTPRRVASQGAGDLIFATEAVLQPGLAAFRVALSAGPRRRVWAGHRVAPGGPDVAILENDGIQRLVNEAVEAYADAVLLDRHEGRDRLNAAVLARTALRQVFTMRPDLYDGADDLLERAHFLDPRGIHLAWRVLLRVVRLVERHGGDVEATAAEAVALSRRALELEPLNSLVLAVASNVASLVERNAPAALELAQRAARRNPSNPLAWDALSTSALHAGKLEEAYVFAVKAQRLAGDTPFKHWYDMGRALMATVTNRLDEALGLAGAASVVPHFKPPLRYIAALHAHAGQAEEARLAVARLAALEADFSADRLLEDPDYPVAALRRSQILRQGLFGILR